MSDTRELILARLLAIANTVPGTAHVSRNNLELADDELPAIVILDGDEKPLSEREGKIPEADRPFMMLMVPEVCLVANESSPDCGPVLNALRVGMINAVRTDAPLTALLGPNGGRHYAGLVSDLGLGRSMIGRYALKFPIVYRFDPTKL